MLDDPQLEELRKEIDAVDHEILALLAKRAEIVLRVGDLKREKSLPVFDPSREAALFKRLSGDADAPLDPLSVEEIFKGIVTHCRRLEEEHMHTGQPADRG